MNRVDVIVAVRPLRHSAGPAPLTRALRVYGSERIPQHGGVVLALNHFSWIDIPCFGVANPRNTYFLAKAEAHEIPGSAQFIRAFGSFAVRRGESDREAVRRMREVVRDGQCARRLRRGDAAALRRPGRGAAGRGDGRAAGGRAGRLRRDPRLADVEARQLRAGVDRVERADALRGLPRGAKGYREASEEIEREIRRLWEWLRDIHAAGRPRNAVPPRAPEALRAPVTLP